jgi:hypothetical protein
MQTFLPFADFRETAEALDDIRLRNQRLEAKTIWTSLNECTGWSLHTAVKMWRGYDAALVEYSLEIIREIQIRGFKDTQVPWFLARRQKKVIMPHWLGDEAFHRSHRSNLIRKNPSYYRDELGWSEPDDLPYVWPKGVSFLQHLRPSSDG